MVTWTLSSYMCSFSRFADCSGCGLLCRHRCSTGWWFQHQRHCVFLILWVGECVDRLTQRTPRSHQGKLPWTIIHSCRTWKNEQPKIEPMNCLGPCFALSCCPVRALIALTQQSRQRIKGHDACGARAVRCCSCYEQGSAKQEAAAVGFVRNVGLLGLLGLLGSVGLFGLSGVFTAVYKSQSFSGGTFPPNICRCGVR